MRKTLLATLLTCVAIPMMAAVPCGPGDPAETFTATPSPAGGVILRLRLVSGQSGGGLTAPVVTTPPGEIRIEQGHYPGILLVPECLIETVHVNVPAGTYNVTWRINSVDNEGNSVPVPPRIFTGVAQSQHANPSVPMLDGVGLSMLAAGMVAAALFLLRR